MARIKIIQNPDQLYFDFDVIEQDLFLDGDLHNIKSMLPQLYHEQHEDVARAEKRFKEGKGYLFTNGTGTGKTYVGLGIVYRFLKRGCNNILIVVPTDQKAEDWIEEGLHLGIKIHKLDGINDNGRGHDVCVTTYANFYQNDAINRRKWDLVEYDESHYLNQNAKGEQTVYQSQHSYVANLPSAAKEKAKEILGEPDRFDYDGYEKMSWQQKSVYREIFHENRRKYDEELLGLVRQFVESTKVVFLSATPFAYQKSVLYADGCLWDIYETIEDVDHTGGYNQARGFNAFMEKHFGYRMRYNKLTIPETGVDTNLMERNFFEEHFKAGVMSTRVLEVDKDYSRHFVTLDSELGEFIDTGIDMLYEKEFSEKYPKLSEYGGRKYNYNFIAQLLEVIKAKEIHVRIKQHLALGRKVVIFHGYNNSTIGHPFRFNPHELLTDEEKRESDLINVLNTEIRQYAEEFPEYWNLDLSSMPNTRESIRKHFSDVMEFNGTVPKAKRNRYVKEFNNDRLNSNVILVQQAAGREGISLHDTTGLYPRVLINLGLPTAPTAAIQIEGRIYRTGVKTNAIYEYATLQTNFEKVAFGEKIATRAKTAENLAMGNRARDLETAFKEGYLASSYFEPNYDQGTGGKESDRITYGISDFDKTKTFYFARGKRTAKNKSREGVDYFATPEPLGYKMVEWANPNAGDHGLEPSAGHGAIARWFPGNTVNHFVEPSSILAADLSVNAIGKIHQHSFENYNKINKADFIIMNPPFGVGGKTAMEHIEKCLRYHLNYQGQLIAIVPNGPSMQKRIDAFMETKEARYIAIYGEIILPSVVFERAGTTVMCKIIKFIYNRQHEYGPKQIDLTYIKKIDEFFDVIEHLNF